MASERNTVSIWFWLFAIIVTALPCVGTLAALFLAFIGENDSRKNYFRAVLIQQLLGIFLLVLLHTLGLGAAIF